MNFVEGDSLGDVVRQVKDRLNGLLAHTITQTPLILFSPSPPGRRPTGLHIAFRRGVTPIAAPLRTRFGTMGLEIGQICESLLTADGKHRLIISKYRYALTSVESREPVLRWEFDRYPAPAGVAWCRQHLQGTVQVPLPSGVSVALNEFHLPTGWVAIEEIIRFCIVDLGVRPLSDDWDLRLRTSHVASMLETPFEDS